MAIFGPQTGYWSPEILMEVDVHAPTLHGRGAAFPGVSLYVLLGRGPGWGWSATSAGADQVDIVAHELCDPMGGTPELNSQYYLRGKRCVAMYVRTDTFLAKPSAGGIPESPEDVVISQTTERSHLGIVQARGTVGGKPVAFVSRRASYGAEVDNALAFVEIMNPDTFNGARDFQRAFGRFTYTFNWFYADDKDIAFQLAGLNPIRPRGVDLDLPVWADRRWDWQGFLPFKDVPKDLNPARGYFANWNNWQAPGFRVSDAQWSYGPVHRSLLLEDRIRAEVKEGDVTVVEMVQAMADAATVDLRGDKVLPWMLEVVGNPSDGRMRRAVGLLSDWHRTGAHRADLEKPHDGVYDHAAAVALMDQWWPRALDAVFRPVLGKAFDDVPVTQDDAPGPVGSAYNNGWYGQLEKDLRMVLGEPVGTPFSRIYCGGGSLDRCRSALTNSLSQAVGALEREFGVSPAQWEADEAGDQIQFVTVGVQEQRPMQWQNRPTFQQVLEFGRPVTADAVAVGLIRAGPG
jgi:acyl-homoserine lactone acylase PvdQ